MISLPPSLSRRRQQTLALFVIGLLCAWFWLVAAHRINDQPYAGFASVFVTGCGDFEHFYHAALAMREGRDPYSAGVHGYIYPPLIAFLFMPLTFFPVKTAAWIMLLVNMAMGVGCAWLAASEVVRRFDADDSRSSVPVVAAVTLLLSATRLRGEIQMWQTNIPMMLAVLLALRFLDARPRAAGLLLGLAVNIKYLPLVYLPYLLLRRRFEAAAWFVLGIAVFAVLPALASGWGANLHHWAIAASGMARLLGIATTGAEVANVDPMSVGHSISITSGIARTLGNAFTPSQVLVLVGALALVAAAALWRVYVISDKPALRWPRAADQQAQPYLGMVALEWMALMSLALAFSPQTNPRHTSLLLMAFAPLAAMLCLPRRNLSRWPALAATAILFFGLALPPNTPQFAREIIWWRDVGGAGWCMLLMLPFFLVAGFRHLDAQRAEVAAVGQRRDARLAARARI